MKQSTNRSLLYGLVGGYLLYIAYELLQNRINNVPSTMAPWLAILFIVLFTGIGITLLVYAWKIWKQGREDQDQNPVDLTEAEAEEKGASEAGTEAAAEDGNDQNPKEPEA
jgi:predicted PurR-regulated permease PerM